MSRILPERCTLVIRNMRSSDFEKIKSFCSMRTLRVVDIAMTYDRRDPPFSGACRMFVDYSSEKDALRAQGLVADFLVPLFTNREFKPFVNIKGGRESQVVNNMDIGSQVHNVGACSKNNTSVLCATLNASSQHDFCIWVGNLPRVVSKIEIENVFMDLGRIRYITIHQGEGRSSAFINFVEIASACTALAKLGKGFVYRDSKMTGDAGFNMSFVLDLLIELTVMPAKSLSFDEAAHIARKQKFAPKCWHDIARHVESLKIDEGLKRLELVERKMSDDSRLAMRFRAQMLKIELPDDTCQPIITLKVVTETESNVGASSTEGPTHHAIHAMAGEGPENQPANSPRLQNRSFLQAAGTKLYEDHAVLWQILCDSSNDPALVHIGATQMLLPANGIIIELVCAYGVDGITGAELATNLNYCLSLPCEINSIKLKGYLAYYPQDFRIQDSLYNGLEHWTVFSTAFAIQLHEGDEALSLTKCASSSVRDDDVSRMREPVGLCERKPASLPIPASRTTCTAPGPPTGSSRVGNKVEISETEISGHFIVPMHDDTGRRGSGDFSLQPSFPTPLASCIYPKSAQSRLPQDAFVCPISFKIMSDPVSTVDGMTYSRAHISEWLMNHDTSPITNELLMRNGRLDKSLMPNHALRSALNEWLQAEAQFRSSSSCRVFSSAQPNLSRQDKFGCDLRNFQRPNTFPSPCAGSGKHLLEWTVHDVYQLFSSCNFETNGVLDGRVDGPTLYFLFSDPKSQQVLTAPAPEGLGLSLLQIKGRLAFEMARHCHDGCF